MTRSFFDGRQEVSRHGYRWWLDRRQLIDGAIIDGEWEPDSTKVVRQFVKPGMVVCDVGANIGYYTVLMAGLVGQGGLVYAFEPMAQARAVAERHADMNGLGNVVLCGLALSDRVHTSEGHIGYSWSLEGEPVEKAASTIREVPLDSAAAGLYRLDFIKIDTDGFELKVLRGAVNTLRRLRPTLLLEVCDYTLQATSGKTTWTYGEGVREMLSLLAGLGYRFLWETDLSPVASIEDTLTRYNLARQSINLVCIPTVMPPDGMEWYDGPLPSGMFVDENEPRRIWLDCWTVDGVASAFPLDHEAIGKPGTPFDGFRFIWKVGRWVRPKAAPKVG